MNVTLPALTCAIPDAWIDQSMALFLMPPPPADPRSLHNKQPVSPANITLTWSRTDKAADDVLATRMAALQKLEGCVVEGAAAAVDDVVFATVSLPQAGQRIYQVHATRRVGDLVVSVVGSAVGATLAELKKHTLAAAASLATA